MALHINPNIKMDSFKNWHGMHMFEFHNYLEQLIAEQYADDIQFTSPDADPSSPFVSHIHRYLQYLFLIQLTEAVSSFNKPGFLGVFSGKNMGRMTDMNTNIRSVYGEPTFKEYSFLSDQGKRLDKVNEYVLSLQVFGVLQSSSALDPDVQEMAEDLARSMVNIRQVHIDPYITQAIDQLKDMES